MIGNKYILLLCNFQPGSASTIIDHIFSFNKYSIHKYFILNMFGDLPDWIDLSRFDGLFIHYSLIACNDAYMSPSSRQKIQQFEGFKAAFVQDDYRWVNDTVDALAFMRINALFPLTGPDIIDEVYSPLKLPGVRKQTVLAGYVPEELLDLPSKPYKDRKLDVGYRARKLPAWMGSHTLQKWQIADNFIKDASKYGLNVDISCREEDRIYGSAWIEFVGNCKATLGTESGASVTDFTGNIQKNVESHLEKHPDTDFETLKELYFKDDDCKIMMNVISPRCFEAAALRTLMILYEGEYSGVLKPWRHYLPLKRDHSNIQEIVDILRSPDEAEAIISRAYCEIAKSKKYTFEAMVNLIDSVLAEEWDSSYTPANNPYTDNEFNWLIGNSPPPLNWIDKKIHKDGLACFHSTTKLVANIEPSTSEEHIVFSLPTSLIVHSVAIRWCTNKHSPHRFSVFGYNRHGVTFKQSIECKNNEPFSVISLTAPSRKKSDLIEIRIPIAFATYDVVQISAKGKVVSEVQRIMYKSVSTLYLAVMKTWSVTPERARKILRPLLVQIKDRV